MTRDEQLIESRLQRTIERLQQQVKRLQTLLKLREESMRDKFWMAALPKAKGETAREIAADAARIADACLRERRHWEEGQSPNMPPQALKPAASTNGAASQPKVKTS